MGMTYWLEKAEAETEAVGMSGFQFDVPMRLIEVAVTLVVRLTLAPPAVEA
jgi:hypothetical protein